MVKPKRFVLIPRDAYELMARRAEHLDNFAFAAYPDWAERAGWKRAAHALRALKERKP